VRGNPRWAAIGLGLAILSCGACAPTVDGPIEHQRAIDREDSARLSGQLARLPGVVAADAVLHHATRDPLAVAAPRPATFTAVITVDDKADAEVIRAATTRLARATLPGLPEAALPIEIHAVVHRPVVASVGPFSVEESSRGPLKATLAVGCLAIAGLAALIALGARRHRLGNSAQ
jgi:hypothetical protein